MLCRLCKKADKSGYSKLANLVVVANLHRRTINEGMITQVRQYIEDLLESVILKLEIKRYEHELESVLENEDYKILWDFSIQTDHVIRSSENGFSSS